MGDEWLLHGHAFCKWGLVELGTGKGNVPELREGGSSFSSSYSKSNRSTASSPREVTRPPLQKHAITGDRHDVVFVFWRALRRQRRLAHTLRRQVLTSSPRYAPLKTAITDCVVFPMVGKMRHSNTFTLSIFADSCRRRGRYRYRGRIDKRIDTDSDTDSNPDPMGYPAA